jgi:exopolysaccharide biosynthesis polyprenyl glycosylphosphotransferase
MNQAALKRAGAELAHAGEAAESPEQREATRLAEQAAAFCLFGLRIALDEAAFRPSAEAPFQAAPETEPPAPANDVAPGFAFPDLPKRGLHLPPATPIRLIQALDWLVVGAAAEIAARWGAGAGLLSLSLGQAFAFIAAALSLKAGLWLTEAYRISPGRMHAERDLGGLTLGAIAGLGVATFVAPNAQSAGALAACVPVAAMLLAAIHAAFAVWIRAAHKAGVFSETVVLIGATKAAERLAARAAKTGEARIVAIVDDRLARSPAAMGAAPVGGNIEELLAWEGLPNVDRIVITVTQKAETRMRDLIARLRQAPNRVDLLLDYKAHAVRGRDAERFGGAAVACVSGRPRNFARILVKRAQDVVLASALLALSALPMLLIAAAIRYDSKGPALYRQRRHGFNNRPIDVLKFRTMRHAPEAPIIPVAARDPRITRVGAFLRRYSLDELPQLINVLRGDMSLVGPRPHAIGMKAADRELTDIVAEYAHRHCVKPGITGWAQVNGLRGSVTSATALRKRLRLDLDYVSRASLWRDLQILARTPGAMWRGPNHKR